MLASGFVERLNEEYFRGELAPTVVERLERLPVDRADVRAFVERMFRLMASAGYPATEVSALHGDVLGSLLARLLPETWSGIVPPITLAGRHRLIDELVRLRAVDGPAGSGAFFDIACGFPPMTTIETAEALPDWEIVGIDPALPVYLVHDAIGNYALFDADRRATYFQPIVPTADNWVVLLGDWQASRARFESLLETLLAERARQGSEADRFEHDGAVLETRPEATYERPNLRFIRGDVTAAPSTGADVIRCFNMLYYFDDSFYERTLLTFAERLREGGLLITGGDWAYTTECRYFTHVKNAGRLQPEEFAFSLDNLSPLAILPWYTMHDDTRDVLMLASLVRELRADADFLKAYLATSDAARAEQGICPRGPGGYYEGLADDVPPAEIWQRAAKVAEAVNSPELCQMAVEVLKRAGHSARVNGVGHIAVKMEQG